jgi:hypothetical protein
MLNENENKNKFMLLSLFTIVGDNAIAQTKGNRNLSFGAKGTN